MNKVTKVKYVLGGVANVLYKPTINMADEHSNLIELGVFETVDDLEVPIDLELLGYSAVFYFIDADGDYTSKIADFIDGNIAVVEIPQGVIEHGGRIEVEVEIIKDTKTINIMGITLQIDQSKRVLPTDFPTDGFSVHWDDVIGKPEISTSTPDWNNIINKPTLFAPTPHAHTISDITNLQSGLDGKANTSHTHDWSDITGKPTSFTPSTHTHDWTTITGKPTTFTPSAHSHAISDVTGLQTALDGKASTSHSHTIANVTGLQTALDGKSSTAHSHAWANITGKPTTFKPSTHQHAITDVTGLRAELDSLSGGTGGTVQQVIEPKEEKAIESWALYYGYPITFSGTWDEALAVEKYLTFDCMVIGDGYQETTHEAHASTVSIVATVKTHKPNMKVVGYVPIGLDPAWAQSNLTMTELKSRVDKWVTVGCNGIFLDEFGFDYRVSRERQNEIVNYCHGLGLFVVANAWLADYAFTSQPMYLSWINFDGNPNSIAPALNENDYFCFENTFYKTVDTAQQVSTKDEFNTEQRIHDIFYWSETPQAQYGGKSYREQFGTKGFVLDGISSTVTQATRERYAQQGMLMSIILNCSAYGASGQYWSASGNFSFYNFPKLFALTKQKTDITAQKINGKSYYNKYSRTVNGYLLEGIWQQDDTTPTDPTLGIHEVRINGTLVNGLIAELPYKDIALLLDPSNWTWYDAPLGTGTIQTGGYIKYAKDPYGQVHIVIRNATSGTGNMFTLPLAYRPKVQVKATIAFGTNQGYIHINPDGTATMGTTSRASVGGYIVIPTIDMFYAHKTY